MMRKAIFAFVLILATALWFFVPRTSFRMGKSKSKEKVVRVKEVRLITSHDYDWQRMGNKMFRYASLLGIAHINGRLAFVGNYTPLDIASVFMLTHAGKHHDIRNWPLIYSDNYATFDLEMTKLPDKNLIIKGNFQSWKYFDDIKDALRQEFTLQPHIKMQSEKIVQSLRLEYNASDRDLVGVHVRQRDNLSHPITLEAPVSFFNNAFAKMRSLLNGRKPLFVVAGNNMTWCRENLKGPDVVVLDDAPAEIHFAVLASCQHGVVSIGTFGWWSSWLSGGHVIYYVKFPIPESIEAQGFVFKDYYPPHWIPVDH